MSAASAASTAVQGMSLGLTGVHERLTTIVRATRLRYAVPLVLLLVAAYWVGIHPWMTNWGSTPAEQQMALPGDDLIPSGSGRSNLALTIDATPDVVWQWLVQIGQDRAGFYSYTWLQNLIGADIHNADKIHPEWQRLEVGDSWRLVSPDYLGGIGKDATTPVLISEPGRTLVLVMWGAHVIEPIDAHRSRLIVRGTSGPDSLVQTMIIDPIVFTMEKRLLLGLKARAEGRPDSPPALAATAGLGWAGAGAAIAALFLSRRRRRYWLLLPTAVALPALLATGDVQAALAGFLAVGITTLGFLTFGRSFLGFYAVLGSVVLLTLLLAEEAYTVIGLAFCLLLLSAVFAMVTAHSSVTPGSTRRLATPTGS